MGNMLQSGGPGGLSDPWKALSVSWDAGTVTGWPTRVSPWEVGSGTHFSKHNTTESRGSCWTRSLNAIFTDLEENMSGLVRILVDCGC